jgi:hypothetical protein
MKENDEVGLNENTHGFVTQISNSELHLSSNSTIKLEENSNSTNNMNDKEILEKQTINQENHHVIEDLPPIETASTSKLTNNNILTTGSINQKELETFEINKNEENQQLQSQTETLSSKSESADIEKVNITPSNLNSTSMNIQDQNKHINRYSFGHANSQTTYGESSVTPSRRLFKKTKSLRTDIFEINPQNSLKTNIITSNISEPDMNTRSLFNNIGTNHGLLPIITNNNFPNRNNFFNKRIYIKYLTNRLEKENEFASILNQNTNSKSSIWSKSTRSNLHHQASLNNTQTNLNNIKIPKRLLYSELNKHNVTPITNLTSTNQLKSNKLYDNQSIQLNDCSTTTSLINFNKMTINKTAKSKSNKVSSSNLNKDDSISENNTDISVNEKSLKANDSSMQTILNKNVVDLNFLGNKSRLASHYLYQSKRQLSELNLHDIWPGSCMYKFSIKANPWVSSFKARTFANEVNSNFRILNQSIHPNMNSNHHSNGNVKFDIKMNNYSSMDSPKNKQNNNIDENVTNNNNLNNNSNNNNNNNISNQTPTINKSHHTTHNHVSSTLPSIKQSI